MRSMIDVVAETKASTRKGRDPMMSDFLVLPRGLVCLVLRLSSTERLAKTVLNARSHLATDENPIVVESQKV
jgi:hypothetical protein